MSECQECNSFFSQLVGVEAERDEADAEVARLHQQVGELLKERDALKTKVELYKSQNMAEHIPCREQRDALATELANSKKWAAELAKEADHFMHLFATEQEENSALQKRVEHLEGVNKTNETLLEQKRKRVEELEQYQALKAHRGVDSERGTQ